MISVVSQLVSAERRSHRSVTERIQVLAPPAVLILFLVIDGIAFDGFLAGPNMTSVLERAAFVGIIAVGMTFLIISGGIDLSVGSVAAFSGIVVARLIGGGVPPLLSLAAAVGLGALIGSLQGIAVVRGRLEPFIVTLAGLLSVRGLALLLSDEQNIALEGEGLVRSLGNGTILAIGEYRLSAPTAVMLLSFVFGAVVLRRTKFGRALFAIGGDERSALMLGVNVSRIKVEAYALSAGLAALAGALLTFWQTTGRPFAAEGWELQAIGAVVVGGTLLTGGRGSVIGSFFGTMLFFVIQASINWLGFNSFWQQLVSGLFLLVVVTTQTVLQNRTE